jgi:hypothetical protein
MAMDTLTLERSWTYHKGYDKPKISNQISGYHERFLIDRTSNYFSLKFYLGFQKLQLQKISQKSSLKAKSFFANSYKNYSNLQFLQLSAENFSIETTDSDPERGSNQCCGSGIGGLFDPWFRDTVVFFRISDTQPIWQLSENFFVKSTMILCQFEKIFSVPESKLYNFHFVAT